MKDEHSLQCQIVNLPTSMTKKVRNELFEAIADIAPKSCFVELMTGQNVRAEESQINVPTLIGFADSFIDPELDVSSLTEMFVDSFSFTVQQINSIYQQTIDQSKSAFWINQRHGQITSSRFKKAHFIGMSYLKFDFLRITCSVFGAYTL